MNQFPALMLLSFVFALLLPLDVRADDSLGTLIFEDRFERNESQEIKDEIGNGWGSNSKSRAAGNKQVDLKDGAMFIATHPVADHAASITHPAEFQNGTIQLRFMLEDPKDSIGLNFADLTYKKVHAGHLFVAKISTKDVQLIDLKTGNMDLKIREMRQAKTVPPEIQKLLKTKSKRFPNKLQSGQWYQLRVDVNGETLRVSIDDERIGEFSSQGIAHPTKRLLRLAVPRNVVVDDVKIYQRS